MISDILIFPGSPLCTALVPQYPQCMHREWERRLVSVGLDRGTGFLFLRDLLSIIQRRTLSMTGFLS